MNATIKFTDISGFSLRNSISTEEQEMMLRVLNLYFTEMIRIVNDYGGSVEKNTGDGLMAYFEPGPIGTPEQNPNFWNSISPIKYVSEISGPVQLHHGTSDESVPWEFSQSLKNALEQAGEKVEYFTYEGSDHNLSGAAFNLAMARSVEFFNKYLK